MKYVLINLMFSYENRFIYMLLNNFIRMDIHGIGSFHIGSRGEGLIYISKKIINDIPFNNGDQLRISVENGKLIVEKL